jgi:hypothetical protein
MAILAQRSQHLDPSRNTAVCQLVPQRLQLGIAANHRLIRNLARHLGDELLDRRPDRSVVSSDIYFGRELEQRRATQCQKL